jgi:hypothetical protein
MLQVASKNSAACRSFIGRTGQNSKSIENWNCLGMPALFGVANSGRGEPAAPYNWFRETTFVWFRRLNDSLILWGKVKAIPVFWDADLGICVVVLWCPAARWNSAPSSLCRKEILSAHLSGNPLYVLTP